MPTMKLTERSVAALKAPDPSGKQVLYWDNPSSKDGLKGFAVLVSGASPTKTFIVQAGVGRGGATRCLTVGRCDITKLADARKRGGELLAALKLGDDPKAARRGIPTLGEAFRQFVEARSGSLSKNSIAAYTRSVNKHLEPWLTTPLNLITVDMVEKRHRKLGEAAGPAAANGAMRALRLIWNFVLEKKPELLAGQSNPVRLRRQWHKLRNRTRMVKSDELAAFYRGVCALPNEIHRDYVLMLLFTGLRRRECAALRWEHVDFKAKAMRVPEENTKTNTKLDLPLSDFLCDLLVARRAVGDAGGWVFPSNSKSGHIEEPKYIFDQVEQSTGINVSPHDLRRTFLTIAESCDISVMALMALANHSPGKSITAGYVQMSPERLREAAQKVADRIKQLCEIEDVTGNVARLR